MDFIEILFILLFIIVPIMEGILRKSRSKNAPEQRPRPDRPDRERSRAEQDRQRARAGGPAGGPRVEEPREISAADMVPEDLWAVLTGERREEEWQREPAPIAVEEEVEPRESEPEWRSEPVTSEPITSSELGSESWESPIEATELGGEPESLEYTGPEAYSLEQPLPPPEVRHRAFHDKIDREVPTPRRKRSWIARGLYQPESLQRAVVFSEILGSPKGMDRS